MRRAISIDSATKLPLESALATFDLADGDRDGSTNVSITYDYETKWGSVGRMMGGILDRQFEKGFTGFVADLGRASGTDD